MALEIVSTMSQALGELLSIYICIYDYMYNFILHPIFSPQTLQEATWFRLTNTNPSHPKIKC